MTDLKKEIKKLQSEVRRIKKEVVPKRTLVKASVVMKLTGWTKKQMYDNRKRHLIEFDKNGRVINYVLESIPPQLIKPAA